MLTPKGYAKAIMQNFSTFGKETAITAAAETLNALMLELVNTVKDGLLKDDNETRNLVQNQRAKWLTIVNMVNVKEKILEAEGFDRAFKYHFKGLSDWYNENITLKDNYAE